MKKTFPIAALASALVTSFVSSPALALPVTGSASAGGPLAAVAPVTEGRWFADYDEAVKVAKKEGKDLLVDFTGSDWCGWCIKLHEEVFDHAEWIDEASKNYVFVALDFPRSDEAKARVPNPKRNEELKKEFGVRGFPTIFLMTTDGVVFAQTGYQAGGPEAYFKHMNEIAAAGKKAMAASARVAEAFTSAEAGDAKWAAWGTLVAAFNDMDADSSFLGQLVEHVRWGIEADPENKAGKKEVAVRALLSKGLADDELVEYAKESDPKNQKGLLELTVDAQFGQVRDDATARAACAALEAVNELGLQDKELGFRLNFQAARWFAGPLDDAAKKALFAKKAMEIGTSDAKVMASLKELLG